MNHTLKVFHNEKLKLMAKKGVDPYDYMDSVDRFNDKQLPSKDNFYSILTYEGITNKQYYHAQNIWNTFQLKSMREYRDLYLISDIILLTDMFENFHKIRLLYYKLDSCHYCTSPGLSWDAIYAEDDKYQTRTHDRY